MSVFFGTARKETAQQRSSRPDEPTDQQQCATTKTSGSAHKTFNKTSTEEVIGATFMG